MIPQEYAYLFGTLIILFPIWLALFAFRRDTRKEMLLVGLVTGIGGPLAEMFYLRDYWEPKTLFSYPFGIEAFLFGFLFGGVSSVIYEEAFGKRLSRRRDLNTKWYWFAFPLAMFVLLGMFVLNLGLGINSMYASIIIFVLIGSLIFYLRRDLVINSVLSGFLMGATFLLIYIIFLMFFPTVIQEWWNLENISGILIVGIPIEEILWAFSWGLVGGPMYEFLAGRRLVSSKS